MNAVLLGVLAYIVLQLVIGLVVSRRIRSEDDYLLAGRRLGPWLATFTVFATWFGAESCIGAAGAVYASGLRGGTADPFGYAGCLLLMGLVFAVPLWRRRYTTVADLFRERYSAGVEKLAVLLMVPTSLLWAAAQIRAFGQVLTVSSGGVEIETMITVAAAVVIVYTAFGGLMADAVTDVVQGLALIVGLAVLFLAVAGAAGGVMPAVAAVEPERLQLFGGPDSGVLDVVEAWAVPVLGSVMAQELVARALAARSPAVARGAAVTGAGLYLMIGLLPVFLGLIAYSLLPGLEDPEQVLPALAREHLTPFLYVLFAGALVSAILSTVDSALLSAAGLVAHNVVVPLMRRHDDRLRLMAARSGVVVFGVLAYVLALHADGVYQLVETASAFGSAGIFVTGVFGLFSRFGGSASAVASLLAGVLTWIVAGHLVEARTPYLLSIGAALAAYVTVALVEMLRTPAHAPAAEVD